MNKNSVSHRQIIISLILLASVIASTVLSANILGGFDDSLTDLFTKNSPDGIYKVSSINVESDKNNVDFIGIAGDKYMANTEFYITKKDNSNFVDKLENCKNYWIASSSSTREPDSVFLSEWTFDNTSFSCPQWLKVRYQSSDIDITDRYDAFCYWSTYFQDEKRLRVSILATSDYGGLKNEILSTSMNNLSVYCNPEIICDFSEKISEDKEYYYTKEFRTEANKIFESCKNDPKYDGKTIVINPETYDIVATDEIPLDIDIELSFKMSYKNASTRLQAKDLHKCVPDWGYDTKGSFAVTPFNMTFDVKADLPNLMDIWSLETSDQSSMSRLTNYMHRSVPKYPSEMTVTLSDGSIIKGFEQTLSSYDDQALNRYSIIYKFYVVDDSGNILYPVQILPDDISAISANDVEIYQK